MAKIGLIGAYIGTLEENNGTFNITNGKKYAKAVATSQSDTRSEATLYGDNGIDNTVSVITKSTVTWTPNGWTPEEEADILGFAETKIKFGNDDSEGQTAYAKKADTEGTRKCIGYIENIRTSGKETANVIFFPQVKFRPPESEEGNTKGDSINFATQAYTGDVFSDSQKNMRYVIPFETEETAIAYLDKIFGVTTATALNTAGAPVTKVSAK